MHLYIAGPYITGIFTSKVQYQTETARRWLTSIDHVLESYHYLSKARRLVNNIKEQKRRIFLDSGAFSAWTKQVEISIDEYAEFVKSNWEIITIASVLDAIGDANATWANQKRLEGMGINVIPCFHFGEPIEVGKYYANNYPYISLGGMVGRAPQLLRTWLDDVWTNALCDASGHAITKVHGFGMTSIQLMQRYPWYSVDSTSWVAIGGFGGIFLPELGRPIAISDRHPSRKDLDQHFSTLSSIEQEQMRQIAATHDLNLDEAVTNYHTRYAFNAYAFHLMGQRLGEDHWQKPLQHRQKLFF